MVKETEKQHIEEITLPVSGMFCAACVRKVEKALKGNRKLDARTLAARVEQVRNHLQTSEYEAARLLQAGQASTGAAASTQSATPAATEKMLSRPKLTLQP